MYSNSYLHSMYDDQHNHAIITTKSVSMSMSTHTYNDNDAVYDEYQC